MYCQGCVWRFTNTHALQVYSNISHKFHTGIPYSALCNIPYMGAHRVNCGGNTNSCPPSSADTEQTVWCMWGMSYGKLQIFHCFTSATMKSMLHSGHQVHTCKSPGHAVALFDHIVHILPNVVTGTVSMPLWFLGCSLSIHLNLSFLSSKNIFSYLTNILRLNGENSHSCNSLSSEQHVPGVWR